MQDITTRNFGIVISYLIPGFGCLLGLAQQSEVIQFWLVPRFATAPSVGNFLFATLGSLGVGLLLSTVRWLVLDTLHHRMGITQPKLDFARLGSVLPSFAAVTAYHYDYYKAYGNGLVAAMIVAGLRCVSGRTGVSELSVWLIVILLLFLGSRDTLAKFYQRSESLIGSTRQDLNPSAKESELERPV